MGAIPTGMIAIGGSDVLAARSAIDAAMVHRQ
jgi:hypothetical protein